MHELTLLPLHPSNDCTPGNAQTTAPKGGGRARPGIPHHLSGIEITHTPPASRTMLLPYTHPPAWGIHPGTTASGRGWGDAPSLAWAGTPWHRAPAPPKKRAAAPAQLSRGPARPAPRTTSSLPAFSSPQDSSRRLRLRLPGSRREAVLCGEGKSLLRRAEGGAGCGGLEGRRAREERGRGAEGGREERRSGLPCAQGTDGAAAPAGGVRG